VVQQAVTTPPEMKGIMRKVQLTPSQTEGFRDLMEGRENLFLTGGPGTSKSFLIREFLD